MTGRRKTVPLPADPEPVESEPVAPILSPAITEPPAGTELAGDRVSEYEMPDGTTFLLTAADAKRAGAKAVRPKNKAVTPSNK